MKKSLYLYLFIVAVLLNIFTYMYFTKKGGQSENIPVSATEAGPPDKWKDSISALNDRYLDAIYFDLSGNQHAQEYFDNDLTPNAITSDQVAPLVTAKLLDFNDARNGNKYTGYDEPMGGQKFIINKIKLLNHRWIIADFSNGDMWGEALIKYFINENRSVDFELIESTLYPKATVEQ